MSFSRPQSSINQTYRPSSSLFKENKDKTHDFFKDTKVGSCSHIVEFKNRCVAVPHKIINSKGRPLSAYKYYTPKTNQAKSVYRNDYSIKPFMHAGMAKKPLVPYNPESNRNKLPPSDFFKPNTNVSKIDIGNQASINRKQWLSTAKDSYQWPVKTPVTNSGILSDIAKRSKQKFYAHN